MKDFAIFPPHQKKKNPPVLGGMTYNFRPIHCGSPSDFVVQNWDREQDYVVLKTELAEI